MLKTTLAKLAAVSAIGGACLVISCSTDIDLLEDYKPITVVYGLLNVNDSIQYIKINKAFVGKGNALVMAQQSDSINYQPGELDVRLQKINSQTGEVLQEIVCFDTTDIVKESGIFSNPYQLLFYTPEAIDDARSYKLLINRPSDGAVVTAVTPVVNNVIITTPDPQFNALITLYNGTTQTYRTYTIRWKHSADAQIYSVKLRFTYYDSLLVSPFTKDTFMLELHIGDVMAGTTPVGGDKELKIEGEGFFNFIASSVQPNANTLRFAEEYLELFFSAGAEDLHTYIEVNKPSIGLIQEKPVFTNITNGTGIFSSRWNTVLRNRMDQATVTKANQVLN